MPKVAGNHFYELIQSDVYFDTYGDFKAYLTEGRTFGGKAWMASVTNEGTSQTGQFWSLRSEAETEATQMLKEMHKKYLERKEKHRQDIEHFEKLMKEQETNNNE